MESKQALTEEFFFVGPEDKVDQITIFEQDAKGFFKSGGKKIF